MANIDLEAAQKIYGELKRLDPKVMGEYQTAAKVFHYHMQQAFGDKPQYKLLEPNAKSEQEAEVLVHQTTKKADQVYGGTIAFDAATALMTEKRRDMSRGAQISPDDYKLMTSALKVAGSDEAKPDPARKKAVEEMQAEVKTWAKSNAKAVIEEMKSESPRTTDNLKEDLGQYLNYAGIKRSDLCGDKEYKEIEENCYLANARDNYQRLDTHIIVGRLADLLLVNLARSGKGIEALDPSKTKAEIISNISKNWDSIHSSSTKEEIIRKLETLPQGKDDIIKQDEKMEQDIRRRNSERSEEQAAVDPFKKASALLQDLQIQELYSAAKQPESPYVASSGGPSQNLLG